MDVLPTLNADAVDKVMQPVVPELINNLGHPAPAVRKGALDALRVYLVHTPNKDSVVKNILHDGLNRPDAHNPFQTNVTTGVILSAPLLLFPSSDSPPPTTQILKDATIAFAARLVQVPHQEAVLKSLMKIRDEVGDEEFESYLADYDDKLKKNIDVLSKIYNIKPSKRKRERGRALDIVKTGTKERILDKSWDSDSDTSGIAEEEDETSSAIPPARVVLETEIKFNEETAITMTILEEKDEDESGNEETGKRENSSSADKRKTPRRVRFGGEIVKLRTPDSDETESIEITPKTRIPLPVSPATKMPETTSRRRPSSQPCSPHAGEKRRSRRRISRSASSSPKREYTHNAQLSPKKSILTRTDGPLIDPVTEEAKRIKKDRRSGEAVSEDKGSSKVNGSAKEGNETSRKEDTTLAQTNKEEKLTKNKENNRAKDENNVSKAAQVAIAAAPKNASSKGEQAILEENRTIDESVSETISRREKNLSPTKPSNPSGPKTIEESKDDSLEMERGRSNEDVRRATEGNFVRDFSNNLPFGSPVNGECEARIDRLVGGDFVDDDEREDARVFDDRAIKYDDGEVSVRNDEGRRGRGGQCSGDRKSASEGNGSVTCSSSEGEGKPREPSWEELGLVGQEVLDDLHNKGNAPLGLAAGINMLIRGPLTLGQVAGPIH
ncbi:fam179b protein [Lasius niger]|uniref:Fam179b protein n=1 Tax=Lasius niger TaxID=67767 RepID=A0A0J7L9T5_LASNI|nr:fam179b protein [Lasius niger]